MWNTGWNWNSYAKSCPGTKQSFAQKKSIHIQKAPDEKNLTEWNEKPKNSKEDETVSTSKRKEIKPKPSNVSRKRKEKKESLKRQKFSKGQNVPSMLRISDQTNPEPEE